MFISRPVYLERISKWLLLSLALVPTVVYRNGLFPFIFGKVLFLRLAITLFSVFFAWFLFKNREFCRQAWHRLSKNPLVITATIFLLLATVSTLMGVNPYRSFFGNVERGEGLLNLIYFWMFFIGAFLLFGKRDWLTFSKITLFVGLMIILDALLNFLEEGGRSGGSFIGNPAFIAAYLIFVIFAALVVWAWSKRKLWRAISLITILAALGGILVTKTRGALIGLGAGLLALLVYALWRGKGVNFRWGRRSFNLRVLAGILLLAYIAFVINFVLTINQPVWENIPGLDRLASLPSGDDNTFQTRLLSAGSSLASVNPANEGWTRSLFGWGSENFSVAYDLHYNPAYFKYSTEWFDKAHNQVLDVLVANGLLGLLAYLTLWGLVIYGLLKCRARDENVQSENQKESENKLLFSAAGIFFSVAYFIQNLALFDQITTYIPVFAFLALVAQSYPIREVSAEQEKNSGWLKFIILIFTLLFSFTSIRYTLVPAQQMKHLATALRSNNVGQISASLDKVTHPYTYIQLELRSKLVEALIKDANDPKAHELIDKSISLLKESVDREEYANARFLERLGDAYTMKGLYAEGGERTQYLSAGEAYLRYALERTHGRQMIMIQLARNLIQQGRFDEVEDLMNEMLALEPDTPRTHFYYGAIIAPHNYYVRSADTLNLLRTVLMDSEFLLKNGSIGDIRNTYQSYLIYFYKDKDPEAFLGTMKRAAELEKLIDEVNVWRLEMGKIKEPPESRVAEIEKSINSFQKLGWDGVSL
ncbi:MAG: O-antigen ligase family protein [Candidatus Colwellbacteria bacterium]|nr:O-antigen ligase family protein [Candidatus Colwellbacteria bacterium]